MVQTTNTQSKGHPTGMIFFAPRLNKGTAFTDAELRKYRPKGLLPPAVTNIEL
jgi:malate dehydrogenase (oxaloacetate-decarboxylating)(NADP+)